MLDVFVKENKPDGLFYPLLTLFLCSVLWFLLAWTCYMVFSSLASSFVAKVEGVVP